MFGTTTCISGQAESCLEGLGCSPMDEGPRASGINAMRNIHRDAKSHGSEGGVPRFIWTETGRLRLPIKDANFLGPQTTLGAKRIYLLNCLVPSSRPLLPPSGFCPLFFLPSFLSLLLSFAFFFSCYLSVFLPLLSLVHEIMLHILPQNLICSLNNTSCKSDVMASISRISSSQCGHAALWYGCPTVHTASPLDGHSI